MRPTPPPAPPPGAGARSAPGAPDVEGGAPVRCLACGAAVERFEAYGVPPRTGRCPACGAKPRNRALLWFLRERVRPRLRVGDRVLEVGPSRFATRFHPRAETLGGAAYVALDVRALEHPRALGPPHGFVQGDVTALPFPDRAFAVILCNHTLSYVRDHARALAEIRRCLAPDGLALVDTPRRPGPTVSAAEHRRLHPGLGEDWYQTNGTEWAFGDDFLDRVRAAGLDPRPERPFAAWPREAAAAAGLRPGAEILAAFRSELGRARFGAALD